MMKKQVLMVAVAALAWGGVSGVAFGGETSVAGYATYWDGSVEGLGGGVKVRKKLLEFLSADVRMSYVDFSDADTSILPMEATLMVGIPFVVEPYAGLGVGYYLAKNSDLIDNGAEGYAVLGLQLNLFVVGAFAEVRWNETEETFLTGMSGNLGLIVKW